MHVDGLLSLTARLFHIELGLLRHVQWDVLLGRRTRRRGRDIKVGVALEYLHHESATPEAEHHGPFLTAKGPQPHAGDNVIRLGCANEMLAIVEAHFPIVQCHYQRFGHPRLGDLQQGHARYRARQIDGVVLLALEVEAVDHTIHAAHIDVFVIPHESNGLRLKLDHAAQHLAVLDGVNVSIPARNGDSVLNIVQAKDRDEGWHRVDFDLRGNVQR
mmetsp:Transcript_68179/g.158222  ORF Transcript_68179/g.158222 Transcript_68179/m.158222 type:complete len:216 (+) Transcript_68179:762-1409(+)